jgi:hypothetical protein
MSTHGQCAGQTLRAGQQLGVKQLPAARCLPNKTALHTFAVVAQTAAAAAAAAAAVVAAAAAAVTVGLTTSWPTLMC